MEFTHSKFTNNTQIGLERRIARVLEYLKSLCRANSSKFEPSRDNSRHLEPIFSRITYRILGYSRILKFRTKCVTSRATREQIQLPYPYAFSRKRARGISSWLERFLELLSTSQVLSTCFLSENFISLCILESCL